MRFLHMLRVLSLVEGVSTLVLFGIAMPLKYAAGMPLAVTIVGTIHGILFTILALMLLVAIRQVPLPPSVAATGLVAAILPGGPFLFDRKLRRHERPLLLVLFLILAPFSPAFAQAETGRPQLDRSKPVPPKSEIVKAWQKRQDAIKTLRFVWTEQQTHPKGWIANPRVPQRERLAIPALFMDRTFKVSKSLTVDGRKMRYSFELDRKEEPDGSAIKSPTGENNGLGERRHYSYVSVFDGQTGTTRLSTLNTNIPPVVTRTAMNADAQNLDTRPILMALRPLDPAMGHALIDRAVTNLMRMFYKGRSTMILEEQRDPSGWKTLMWLEPERDFLVSRYIVLFEQRIMIDVDIDYVQDARWGWIPNGWRVTEKLNDGTKRVLSTAKVTSYTINQPIPAGQFQ